MNSRWPPFIALILIISSVVMFPGCASSKPSKRELARISEMELQEQLQRFATQFSERMSQSMIKILDTKDPKVRSLAAHQSLRFATSVLDIVTGPRPELNLLDMMTFIRLNHQVVKEYWIPKFYGAKGQDLLTTFQDSEREIGLIADTRMTPEQRQAFDRLLESWRKENPTLVLVEGVRLTDFAKHAGKIEAERSEEIGGLVSGIKGAVSTADQAILLANRAIFLGQRMPTILRLQTRVGVQEILSDSMKQLASAGEATEKTRKLAQDLSGVMLQVNEAMRQAGPLIKEYRQNFPYNPDSTLSDKLTLANQTIVELRNLLADLNSLSPNAVQNGAKEVKLQINSMIWNTAMALALVGFLLIGFWWLGYFLVKRFFAKQVVQGNVVPPSAPISAPVPDKKRDRPTDISH